MTPSIADALAGVFVALLATGVYAVERNAGARWAGTLPGHALGVLGAALMLVAAIAYTRRKRVAGPASTDMRAAMRLHVVAGLLGPYLVVLHSGFAFGGLAGALSLVMLLVVASGVVGRALFTLVPRTVATADPVRAAMLDAEFARLEIRLADLLREGAPDPAEHERIRREMVVLQHQQEVLRRDWSAADGGALWRRALSGWWYLHVPASAALWVLAVVHVVAALWYSTFSR